MADNTDKKENKKTARTIMIFGVGSFVGSNLAEFFKKHYRVIGTYHHFKPAIKNVLTISCDVLKKEEVQSAIFAFRPDIIIYAVGVHSIFDCSENTDKADLLNANGLFNVAEYGQRYRAQICSLSSHYVFSGVDRSYYEMDIPDPETTLGKTQSSAEFYIQKTALNYLIFRCCNLYGRGVHPYKENFFETLQRKISNGEEVTIDDSVRGGFLDIAFVASLLKICFDKGVNNRLFQVSSSDIASFYEFTNTYCEVFHETSANVRKGTWRYSLESGIKSSDRELFYQLDTINIESFLNVKMPSIKESLEFTYKRMRGNPKIKAAQKKGDGISYI